MNNIIDFSGAVIIESNIKNRISGTQKDSIVKQEEDIRILLELLEQKIKKLEGNRKREKFLLQEFTSALEEHDRETMKFCCEKLKNCLSGVADIATILGNISMLLT